MGRGGEVARAGKGWDSVAVTAMCADVSILRIRVAFRSVPVIAAVFFTADSAQL